MIGMLTGRVESVETDTALIDVGGVATKCACPPPT